MYIVPLKTAVTEALRATLDSDYINADFRSVHVSIEFPMEQQHYPSVWIDWEPTSELRTAGIGHFEIVDTDDGPQKTLRWRFQGSVTFTVVAMTSLERDRLLDEMIRIMAFGSLNPTTSPFRQAIEDNDLLAMNFDFDEIAQRGFTSNPGTPWGTDDMVYEATLAMECVGEFLSDAFSLLGGEISKVALYPYADSETDPTSAGGWQ